MLHFKYFILCLFLISSTIALGQLKLGDEQIDKYINTLQGKRVGVVVNQTSMIGDMHLVDTLSRLGINIVKIFAPEHGFRGDAEAGAHINSTVDKATGVEIVSLYGKNYMPTVQDMAKIDILVFDVQDVGTRFYTYLSTLHYVMQACADNKKPLLLLDRPNPNAFYIDGPILESKYKSFVGLHPIPIVYGCTLAEMAKMINGEKWLDKKKQCKLIVIPCTGYNHSMAYNSPIPPSPNLRSLESVYLYPSLCLFEGTNVSVGRGTDQAFECIGLPKFAAGNYSFTPRVIKGRAENPPYLNVECNGFLLKDFAMQFIRFNNQLYLDFLIGFYKNDVKKDAFFNSFFDKLAGTASIRQMIIAGKDAKQIRESWQLGIYKYKKIRLKYLIYPEK